jgi:hypothetical protein
MRAAFGVGCAALLLLTLGLAPAYGQSPTPLTCTNAQGVFTFAPTPVVTPPVTTPVDPPTAGASWGYRAGTFTWAGDFSYNAAINYHDTAGAAASGSPDIAVTLTGPWGAWQPFMASSFSFPTKGQTQLTFRLKPTVANQRWQVFFVGVGDKALPSGCVKNVLSYGPAPLPGVWARYTVPLADLCVLGLNVYKFDIQDQTGLTKNTWYVDEVGFLP